ncbi:MAG TPA: ABC transporter ATP-binding protein [Gemmatimonadales bacterium]|jgi:iron complex transport system ATP-binding protein
MIFETRDLTVRYPGAERPALDQVTLGVEPGALVAVAGPNGSGKTTLIRALLGTVPLAGGMALLNGRPSLEWPRQELARWVGVVTQREELWVPLTVEEVVLMGRYPRLGALSPVTAVDRSVVRTALERCDVLEFQRRQADSLSGGEWQRVRIARALAQEPRALVLDEPTSALDIKHEMEVLELVRTLVGEGMACLLVTHRLNVAARYADRIILLESGRLVAGGPPRDVLTAETLSQVFHWPIALTTWRDGTPQLIPLRPHESGSQPDSP